MNIDQDPFRGNDGAVNSLGQVVNFPYIFPYESYPGTMQEIQNLGLEWYFITNDWANVSDLLNQAFLKALSKASDSKTNLAVMLKEADKTSKTILTRANQLFRAYSSARKGRFREAATHLGITSKTVHKTWLEYKYGWMPLLLDIKGSAEFFAQQVLGGRPPSFTVVGKASRKGTWNQSRDWALAGGHHATQTLTLHGDQECKVKMWLEIDNRQLQEIQQLGITNPALYVWEVIPFSFVFDWIVSVGDYLQGLTALNGLTVKKAMSSFVDDYTVVSTLPSQSWWVPSGSPDPSGHQYDIRTWTWTLRARHYQRGSFDASLTRLRPPLNSPYSSFSKMATSLALLRTQAQRWVR
jgi:hypothetical protein